MTLDPGQRARVQSVALALSAAWLAFRASVYWQIGKTIQASLTTTGAVLAVVLAFVLWREKRW